MAVVERDITSESEAAEALRQSEADLRRLEALARMTRILEIARSRLPTSTLNRPQYAASSIVADRSSRRAIQLSEADLVPQTGQCARAPACALR